MKIPVLVFASIALAALPVLVSPSNQVAASAQGKNLQVNTLCAKDERVIFACVLKQPAKIVSVCASKNVTSETGYLQYRFGLPGKVELEFVLEHRIQRGDHRLIHVVQQVANADGKQHTKGGLRVSGCRGRGQVPV